MFHNCLDALAQKPNFSILSGFDGYIDSVMRVKREDAKDRVSYFKTIGEFGEYISSKAGISGSLALSKNMVKMGGNMPNYAWALSSLDAQVSCVGALGYPNIHEAFGPLSERCELIGVCAPGKCDALEFEDGKLMLAENGEIDTFDFELLKSRVGLETIAGMCGAADMIALLNWSELLHATSLWQGMLSEVFAGVAGEKPVFMDFSDCSARPEESISELNELICGFSKVSRVYVSVNENEAKQLIKKLGLGVGDKGNEARMLHGAWGCAGVIVHLTDGCSYVGHEGAMSMASRMIERPKLLTGGGDNFNAGFCYALLSGLQMNDCLRMANAVSGYYVHHGHSPDRVALARWMTEARYFEISEEREA